MSLHVVTGPMFAGKSTFIMNKLSEDLNVSKKTSTPKKVLYINHVIDTRSEEQVSTHNSVLKTSPEFERIKSNTLDRDAVLRTTGVDIYEYDSIAIDECQFFRNLVSSVKDLIERGKTVYCSSLDGTSEMIRFGDISELLHLSDTFVKITAICEECMREGRRVSAPFTRCKVKKSDTILISGSQDYESVCREHHL